MHHSTREPGTFFTDYLFPQSPRFTPKFLQHCFLQAQKKLNLYFWARLSVHNTTVAVAYILFSKAKRTDPFLFIDPKEHRAKTGHMTSALKP